jgi:L-threonylcarbamoyladenylate synthase
VASLGDRIELVLDGGLAEVGLESTVLDVRGTVPVILRPGGFDLAALRSVDPRVIYADAVPLPEAAARPSPGMDARHYAPRARVVLASSRIGARAEAEVQAATGRRVGLLLRGAAEERREAPPFLGGRVERRTLPDDPVAYARALYDTLHALDADDVAAIVVEAVPDSDAWRAVADRLARASSA